jgi:hypothetical protein
MKTVLLPKIFINIWAVIAVSYLLFNVEVTSTQKAVASS